MAVFTNIQEKYMKEALKQAKKAYALGEVPIGCVIVHEGKIIGRGYNRRNTDKNTLSHAEITAIRKASKVIGDWRLEECTLYVTLEPCQMCAGAIVQARIPEVVMGCMNPKAGCAGSILNILEMPQFNHQVTVSRGILEEECNYGKECRHDRAYACTKSVYTVCEIRAVYKSADKYYCKEIIEDSELESYVKERDKELCGHISRDGHKKNI